VRLGVVLDAPEGPEPLASLARQAAALEARGIEVAWLEEGARTGPPLITAAALAARTSVLRLVACVRAGEHPLAIAEAAAVADNCSNGRLVVAVVSDDAALLAETADALLAATAARPFRHAGERWTIPANRPENDGAQERIVVTPACAQLELPLWLLGEGAAGVARGRCLPVVADEATPGPPEPAATRLVRPALHALEADADGGFDADALVGRLRRAQQAWGLDLAVVRLPERLTLDARLAAIARLASFVRPRVVQVPLPDGLEAYWAANLAGHVRRLPEP
jgi:alkanesulfonate monooxygenase SsuD/methylene tetrahydromethanopterin reductase-like flavin-dependent oxidoreductase (luciferase family)